MEDFNKTSPPKQSVHKVLAHSYFFFFFLLLISICLDLFFNSSLGVFDSYSVVLLGFLFLIFATFLIVWAQKTSRKLNKENINKETFTHGPYRFTRAPTHLGLFFLTLGLGLVSNAIFIVVFAFVNFFIAKFFFLKKEEDILTIKYGAPYIEYKKSVKL
ncbi:MAG: methyltransferase [Minisyncoccia bacterium]